MTDHAAYDAQVRALLVSRQGFSEAEARSEEVRKWLTICAGRGVPPVEAADGIGLCMRPHVLH